MLSKDSIGKTYTSDDSNLPEVRLTNLWEVRTPEGLLAWYSLVEFREIGNGTYDGNYGVMSEYIFGKLYTEVKPPKVRYYLHSKTGLVSKTVGDSAARWYEEDPNHTETWLVGFNPNGEED